MPKPKTDTHAYKYHRKFNNTVRQDTGNNKKCALLPEKKFDNYAKNSPVDGYNNNGMRPNTKPPIRAIKLVRTLFLNISSILSNGSSAVIPP